MIEIAFLTFFLGITTGARQVDLRVTGSPAAVEIEMDGNRVATLRGAPWRAKIDFGYLPTPHRLSARALDGSGNVVAEARQNVNLMPEGVGARVELDLDSNPRTARVLWDNIDGTAPVRAEISLDGKKLEVRDFRAFLPPVDLNTPHVVRAVVRFRDRRMVEREAVFGGGYFDTSRSELTAIVVQQLPGVTLPSAEAMNRWFVAGTTPLRVRAVENPPAEIMVVRDPAADFARRWARQLDSAFRLEDHEILRFVWPLPRMRGGTNPSRLYPLTPDIVGRRPSLGQFLSKIYEPTTPDDKLSFADAVSVAAVEVRGRQRPRVLLLILPEDGSDASRAKPEDSRRFLEKVNVPLVVWSLVPIDELPPSLLAWGDIVPVDTKAGRAAAARALRDAIESQRVVWIEGNYLPHEIALTAAAREYIEKP